MNDLSNPFATSVFLAAQETMTSAGGRVLRQFVASFVFAAAVGLVVIGAAAQIDSATANEEATASFSVPNPEYAAAQAAAEEQQDDSMPVHEASAR